MRVLHLISSGGMYGAEAVILNLSAELQASGGHTSEVAVFAHNGQPPPALYHAAREAGLSAYLLPCRGQLDRDFARRLRELVHNSGADVLHTHGYKADIYAYLAFRVRRPVALVSTCHTWYDNDPAVRLYGAADRWVLRAFDEVVAVSPEVGAQLQGAGVAETRVHLIRNGIRVEPFESSQRARAEARSGGLLVGLVGRLAPEKGVDILLLAAAQVARTHPQARFVVAGDGPDRVALERLLVELKLPGRVQLTGAQTNMPAFYSSLDVLVSASRQEGLPMALLEGMASGLPVVATSVGAVPQIVRDGETGLLVPPNSPERLAQAIRQLLDSTELRSRFGAAGRARVVERFSAARMTSDYLAVYRRALRRSSVLQLDSPEGSAGLSA